MVGLQLSKKGQAQLGVKRGLATVKNRSRAKLHVNGGLASATKKLVWGQLRVKSGLGIGATTKKLWDQLLFEGGLATGTTTGLIASREWIGN